MCAVESFMPVYYLAAILDLRLSQPCVPVYFNSLLSSLPIYEISKL